MTSHAELPFSRVYVGTGDPIEENNLVEFRLIYEGNLPSSGNKAHAEEKHAIRRVFHPQLRRLWETKQTLLYLADQSKPIIATTNLSNQERFELGVREIGKMWNRAGYDFVPLVVPQFALQCSIEILLLRPENLEVLGEWADLDGQVKTILDALTIPESAVGLSEPDKGEIPFFCLLQNDKLVSEIKVTADKLLAFPKEVSAKRDTAIGRINILLQDSDGKWKFAEEDREAIKLATQCLSERTRIKPNSSFVVIHVRINHREPRAFDNYFG